MMFIYVFHFHQMCAFKGMAFVILITTPYLDLKGFRCTHKLVFCNSEHLSLDDYCCFDAFQCNFVKCIKYPVQRFWLWICDDLIV